MIWFKIKAVEDKICHEDLSDREGINYFLAIVTVVFLALSLYEVKSVLYLDLLIDSITFLVNMVGIKAVYFANKRIDGKNFFNRYVALSWVIGTRVVFVAIAAIAFIIFMMQQVPCAYKTPAFVLSVVIFEMIFVVHYLLIVRSLRRIQVNKQHHSIVNG